MKPMNHNESCSILVILLEQYLWGATSFESFSLMLPVQERVALLKDCQWIHRVS